MGTENSALVVGKILELVHEVDLEDLDSLVREIQAEGKRRKDLALVDFTREFKEKAKQLGINVGDVANLFAAEGKPARKKASASTQKPPKYRDPENHENTWSGRGPNPPLWFRQAEEKGYTREQLEAANQQDADAGQEAEETPATSESSDAAPV